jgi:hypothetical protein
MEYNQGGIIKFLANDGLGAGEIEMTLRAQFAEGASAFGTV